MAAKAKKKETESLEYRTEVKQLLDILAHSLYSDRDIFLRELISNASDALNRIQFELLTNQDVVDPTAELAIHIVVDEEQKRFTISDSGIGMNRDDMVNNLGTIAHSGAKSFLQNANSNGDGKDEKPASIAEIIGQFGVGFYSAFMVAEQITVTSRSHNNDDEAYSWTSTGDSTFTLAPADKAERGTSIEIVLKEDAHEYATTWKLESIIKKHSDYVSYPIYVTKVEVPQEDDANENSEENVETSDDPNADIEVTPEAEPTPVNQQTALWRQQPSSVGAEEYKSFYQQLTFDFQEPLVHLHLVTDTPADIRSILYVPSKRDRGPMMRGGEGLKLYSRKVLIQEASSDLLPEYYRFIEGVIDSEDLPLNVSREMVQSNPVMRQIKKALTSRVNHELKRLADKKPAQYARFWGEFGMFIKEGIASTPADQEGLVNLLRFHSTKSAEAQEEQAATEADAAKDATTENEEGNEEVQEEKDTSGLTSLKEYVDRMKVDQENIYYVIGEDKKSIVHSPHLDYFRANDIEVLYFTDPIDGYMVSMLREFEEKQLKNVDDSSLDLPESEDEKEDKAKNAVPENDFETLVERIKSVLADRITDVSESKQLVNSPCRLVTPEGNMDRDLQRILRMTQEDYEIPKKLLELNRSHPVVVNLSSILIKDENDPLINPTIEQLFGNALLLEGQHPNPADLVQHIQTLMEAAVSSRATS